LATPNPIRPGAVLTYTLTLINNGTSDATGVVITDTFSTNVAFKSVTPPSPLCTYPAVPGNQVVCTLGQVAASSSKVVTLSVTVKSTATSNPVNQVIASSSTQDPDPSNNVAQEVTTLDGEAPTVSWFAPVFNDGHYWIGTGVIRLMVNASDNLGISKVRFYRWDEPNQRFVDIGIILTPPYYWYLNTGDLNPAWNEIDIEAYDTAGNLSSRQRIYIYRLNVDLLYLPLMSFR
jgi:uncharacterized repeat protein (TIGR01451 family)